MNVREQQVTTFAETATPTITRPYYEMSVPSPYPTETITEWLSRPFPLGTYTWNSTDVVGAVLAEHAFPSALYKLKPLEEKLAHFKYMRASVRFVLRMNGTRSHFGRILMHWNPFGSSVAEHQVRTSNIFSSTGYPHVVVSPTGGDVSEILVPFISPYLYTRANAGRYGSSSVRPDAYDFGFMRVLVLNVLQNTAGNTPVSFTLYANFENVQLAGYTDILSAPEGGVMETPYLPVEMAKNPVSGAKPRYVAQAGRSSRGRGVVNSQSTGNSAQASEATTKAVKGTTSSILEKVGHVAASLSTVPGVGQVSSLVSPIAYGLSALAQHFGYFKPDTLQSTRPVINRYIDTATTHGEDTATKLAIIPDNYIADGMSFMGGNSEMDFDTICSRPMLIKIVEWKDQASGDFLTTIPLSPCTTHTEASGSDLHVFPTYLSWVANAFKYWRGDLRMHIQVTSSVFHSGRLAISYEPENFSPNISSTVVSNTATRVVDIQTDTEISFSIPYLALTPYLQTASPYATDDPAENIVGTLVITVLNELTSSQAPVLPVYLNIWLSGTNMQFGVPIAPRFDYDLNKIFKEDEDDDEETVRYVAQAGYSHSIQDIDYPPLIQATSHRVNGLCFGENCDTVRDLISRPTPMLDINYDESLGTAPAPLVSTSYAFFTHPASIDNASYPLTNPGRWGLYRFHIVYKFAAGNSPDGTRVVLTLGSTQANYGALMCVLVPEDGGNEGVIEGYVRAHINAGSPSQINVNTLQGTQVNQDITVQINLFPVQADLRLYAYVDIHTPILVRYDRALEFPADNIDLSKVPSYLAYFLSIYRFWRGSIRYKLFQTRDDFGSLKVASIMHKEPQQGFKLIIDKLENTTPPVADYENAFHHGLTSVKNPVSNALEATVPYYYNTLCKLSHSYSSGVYSPKFRDGVRFQFAIEKMGELSRLEAKILVSAGDDFEFAFLVPPDRKSVV